jgi:NADP-dependent 3-hydroxy acid dehydrogenase YdfG
MLQLPNNQLRQKTAIVTGASSGVGQSIALALAGAGANVALVGRRLNRLRQVTKQCNCLGSESRCYQVDLLDVNQIRHLRKRVLKDFAAVEVLIHCAGVIALANMAKASLKDFDWQYHCNIRAPFALTQVFLASLIARKGQIVFINSTAGLQASARISQYSATKHALKAIADSLREEINSEGVRVLSIYLGRTATPMQAKVHEDEGKFYDPKQLIQPEQVAAVVVNALTIGREAEITDIRIRPMQKPGTQTAK